MKNITIVSPTYNEEALISEFLNELLLITKGIKKYKFDFIIIDNNSTDKTQDILMQYAKKYKNIKLIFNIKNFGHIKSPYWGVMQSTSDATIYLVSDLQEPPTLIPNFIREWEKGYKVVYGVRESYEKDHLLISIMRKFFYYLINSISETNLIKNATGFGLYDRKVIDIIKKINDPYPYFRGLVADIGYPIKQLNYRQKSRKAGRSKNNFYTLYDMAILGIINHSYLPLRACSFLGLALGIISLLTGLFYFFYKILFWHDFDTGIAPLIIINALLFSFVLFVLGILGEYLITILRYVNNRPIVIEKERINFDN